MYLVLGIPDPVALRTAQHLVAQGAVVSVLGGAEARALLPAGVRYLLGDPASIDFGLTGADYQRLLGSVDELILADTTYVSSGEVERNRLVRQAAEVAEFVRAGGAPRGVRFLSSLLVFGGATGQVSEDELEVGQRFRDEYEESLAVAEKIIRGLRPSRPLAIVRSAPVSGDEQTGELYPRSPLAHLARDVQSGGGDSGYAFSDLPVYFETVDRAAQALFRLLPEESMSVVHLADRKPFTDRALISYLAGAAGRSVHELPKSVRAWSALTRPNYPGSRSVSGWDLRFSRRRAEELLGDLLDREQSLTLHRLFVSQERKNEE